jgi:hypothetical protein
LKNLFLAIALSGLVCGEAAACSCAVTSFEGYVKNADSVYFATLEEAKVVRDDPDAKWPFIQGRFNVKRTFKGVPRTGEMMLRTGLGGGDCGVPMFVSQTYIIFKNGDIDGIADCDGSHAIYGFEEDEIAAKVRAALNRRPFKHKRHD